MAGQLQPCGTIAAYVRHYRNGEAPCEACHAARVAYDRSRYVPHPRRAAPCGTTAGYQRHLRDGEETCRACRDALNIYNNSHAGALNPELCGTTSGASMHRRRGEKPCDACWQAYLVYQRAYRERRKAAEAFEAMLAEVWAEVSAA